MLARLIAYAHGIVRRRSISAEVEDELRFHLEQEIDAHIARGLSISEAKRLARRDLGGLTQTRLRHGDLEVAQHFKQESLKLGVGSIDLIDQ